uniref:Uncharacterized protein n=1 Tax=Glossina pallidipes TaxID=7398 RepID=A0A1B0A852_GLOPL
MINSGELAHIIINLIIKSGLPPDEHIRFTYEFKRVGMGRCGPFNKEKTERINDENEVMILKPKTCVRRRTLGLGVRLESLVVWWLDEDFPYTHPPVLKIPPLTAVVS